MFNITVFLMAYLFIMGEAQRVLRISVSVIAFLILVFVQFPRIFLESNENRRVEIDLLFGKFQVLNFFSRPVNVIRWLINILQAVCALSDREVWHFTHDDMFGSENEIIITTIHHWFMTFIIIFFFPVIVDTFVLSKELGKMKILIQGCTAEFAVIGPVLLLLYLGFSGALICCETAHVVLEYGLHQQQLSYCHLIGEGYLCGHTPDVYYRYGETWQFKEYGEDCPQAEGFPNYYEGDERCSFAHKKNGGKNEVMGPTVMHDFKAYKFQMFGHKTFLDSDSLFYTADGFMDHNHSLTSLMTISFSNFGLTPTALSLEEEFFLIFYCVIAVLFYMNVLVAGFSAKAYYILDDIDSLLAMGKTREIIEIESLMTMQAKRDYWDSLHFEKQVPFMLGDTGLTGGLETAEVLTSRYVAPEQVDNIIRYTGKADKDLPWPQDNTDNNESADMQLDKQLRGLKKLYKQARQILRSEAGHGSGSGNDGSSNDNSDDE
jgi:hypothetical protein